MAITDEIKIPQAAYRGNNLRVRRLVDERENVREYKLRLLWGNDVPWRSIVISSNERTNERTNSLLVYISFFFFFSTFSSFLLPRLLLFLLYFASSPVSGSFYLLEDSRDTFDRSTRSWPLVPPFSFSRLSLSFSLFFSFTVTSCDLSLLSFVIRLYESIDSISALHRVCLSSSSELSVASPCPPSLSLSLSVFYRSPRYSVPRIFSSFFVHFPFCSISNASYQREYKNSWLPIFSRMFFQRRVSVFLLLFFLFLFLRLFLSFFRFLFPSFPLSLSFFGLKFTREHIISVDPRRRQAARVRFLRLVSPLPCYRAASPLDALH